MFALLTGYYNYFESHTSIFENIFYVCERDDTCL
jgi:hypothetical protein